MAVGYLEVTRVLDDSRRGQALSKKLQGIAQKWQGQIAGVRAKLDQARDRLRKTGVAISGDTAFLNRRDIALFEAEIRGLEERMQIDINANREHFRNQLLEEIHALAANIAEEANLEMLLLLSKEQVAYAAAGKNLTDVFLKRFDAKGPPP